MSNNFIITGLNEYQALTDETAIYPGCNYEETADIVHNMAQAIVEQASAVAPDSIAEVMKTFAPILATARNAGLLYVSLGLGGETGEFLDKVKKIMRDNNGVIDETIRVDLAMELGDILWFVAQAAKLLRFPMEDIAVFNIWKLRSRKERGVLQGYGDKR
jgi:NTP pyrophosphatase (non-canonical NTP hydrolase)